MDTRKLNKENKGTTGEVGGPKGSSTSPTYNAKGSKITSAGKSGNSALGIDSVIAIGSSASSGSGRAMSRMGTSKEMNSGASNGQSSFKGLADPSDVQGTVGKRENMYGGRSGQFGRSAKHGSVGYEDPGTTYGPNSRWQGTGGDRNPGGSMALARQGMKGSDKEAVSGSSRPLREKVLKPIRKNPTRS